MLTYDDDDDNTGHGQRHKPICAQFAHPAQNLSSLLGQLESETSYCTSASRTRLPVHYVIAEQGHVFSYPHKVHMTVLAVPAQVTVVIIKVRWSMELKIMAACSLASPRLAKIGWKNRVVQE
jgi:hypothetical protein